MSDFYYERAVRLPPADAVLFMFNYENNTGINMDEVTISPPYGTDEQGHTMVKITGLNGTTVAGDGGYFNTATFGYYRVALSQIGLSTTGSFFDVIGSRPGFLDIVEELTRQTQFNCSPEDFYQVEYRSDIEGGYVLKAHPNSWRFTGEINIGHPRRANFDDVIPAGLELSFEDYNGIFDLKVDRLAINYDLTEYPTVVPKLIQGYKVQLNDIVLFNTLLVQADYSGLTLTNSTTPDSLLNIYQAQVIYHGPLRQDKDPKHLFTSRDMVIELQPSSTYAPLALGTMKLYYASTGTVVPTSGNELIYAMQMYSTPASGSLQAAFWSQCVVGKVLEDNGGAMDVSVAFEAAFGLSYDALIKRALKVTYNGPARPNDLVPEGKTTCNVVELSVVDSPLTFVYGPAKVYY